MPQFMYIYCINIKQYSIYCTYIDIYGVYIYIYCEYIYIYAICVVLFNQTDAYYATPLTMSSILACILNILSIWGIF